MDDFSLQKALQSADPDDEDDIEPVDFVLDVQGHRRTPGTGPRLERQKVTSLRQAVAQFDAGDLPVVDLQTQVAQLTNGFQSCLTQCRYYRGQAEGYPEHEVYWDMNVAGYERVLSGLALLSEGLGQQHGDYVRQGLSAFEGAIIDLEDIIQNGLKNG